MQNLDAPTRRHRPHVVLAEDDDDFRCLLQQCLEVDGYQVTAVATGSSLVDNFVTMSQGGETPALVISDDRMPGLRGMHALQRLRERGTTIPFVLITAFGTNDLVREAETVNVIVLNKPFDLDDLRTLASMLAPSRDESDVCVACGNPDDLDVVTDQRRAMFCRRCRDRIESSESPSELGGES